MKRMSFGCFRMFLAARLRRVFSGFSLRAENLKRWG